MSHVQGRTEISRPTQLMRTYFLALKFVLLLCIGMFLPACASVRTFLPQQAPVCVLPPNATYTQIVNHLNNQTAGVYGWQSSSVKIKARQKGGLPMPALNAMLIVEQPKRFRLRASSPLGLKSTLAQMMNASGSGSNGTSPNRSLLSGMITMNRWAPS
ncbi:hypothetical protein [Gimesia maris]|uniref:hypothetical protein n=1 Tax=Gimesia maris TaxID=122 RepID=UPI0012D3A622|nr:hypothetical protein [Gimesia maris]QGQ29697.1 hypothetical protein F1729_14110 [Gimesia maris]